jgi:hypothetical protein
MCIIKTPKATTKGQTQSPKKKHKHDTQKMPLNDTKKNLKKLVLSEKPYCFRKKNTKKAPPKSATLSQNIRSWVVSLSDHI